MVLNFESRGTLSPYSIVATESQKVWLLALGGNFSRQRTHQSSLSCIQLDCNGSWRERKKLEHFHHSYTTISTFFFKLQLLPPDVFHYIILVVQRYDLWQYWWLNERWVVIVILNSERLVITDILLSFQSGKTGKKLQGRFQTKEDKCLLALKSGNDRHDHKTVSN